MKILKILGGILAGLVVLILLLGLFAPTHTHVERSATIEASADQVRTFTHSFAGMEQWSPWRELDPNQVTTIENDGVKGAKYTWSGNEQVGSGEQEITSISENEVITHLHFITPFEAEADAVTTIEETEEGIKVTWSYDADSPYPMNVMNLFMNMDDMLGPDFQKGMDKLKLIAEEEASKIEVPESFEISAIELETRVYLGKRSLISWNDMQAFFQESFGAAQKAIIDAKLEMKGMPSGVYFLWDEENQQTDLLAGIPVSKGSIDGLDAHEVSGKALMIDYYGPYEGTGDAHMAMESYMNENGFESTGIAIEEYVTDPTTEEDSLKWHTKIYYPIL